MDEIDPRAMFLYENRLKTYGNWIYKNNKSARCTAEKMAKAGFYLQKNETDSTKCFVCLKMLDGWEVDDDPFEEHKRHKPDTGCPYVELGKTEEKNFTVSEFLELIKDMHLNLENESFREGKKKLLDMQERMVKELKNAEKKK